MTCQTTAQQWIRTKDRRTGRQLAVAVPSASVPGKFHLTTSSSCDCRGFFYRQTCSHLRAVRAEIAARQAPTPAADRFVNEPSFEGTVGEMTRRERLVSIADSVWGVDGE
jgi:hypothetical protein